MTLVMTNSSYISYISLIIHIPSIYVNKKVSDNLLTIFFIVIYHLIIGNPILLEVKNMGIHKFTVNRIYELCRERKITPNALSYMAGIPQATVKSILNGESKNPGIVTLKKICDGLDITMVEFFDTPEYHALEQEIK